MTDKHLNENSSFNTSGNPCCFNFDKYFFPRITAFQQKIAFFVFRYNAFVLKWLPWQQQKYHSHISDVSSYSSIKFLVHISSTDGNIRDWLLLNCAFIISDVTQSIVLQFCKTSKNNIFGFSVVFSRKIVQISIFKVENLENGVADF